MWVVVALLTAVAWGLYYVSIGQVLKTTDKTVFICLVSVINAPIYFFLASRQPNHTIEFNKWLVIAILSSIIGNFLTFWAVELKSATHAAFIEVSYPVWCVLFCYLLLGEVHLTWKSLVGGLIILIGIGIFVLGEK